MLNRKSFKKYYFGRLFLKDKFLFGIIVLFFSGAVVANLIKLEETPFFTWSMYSQTAPAQDHYALLEIRYGANTVLNIPHTWEQPQNMLLQAPLGLYIARRVNPVPGAQLDYLEYFWMRKHPRFRPLLPQLAPTAADFDAFPAWYKSYLTKVTGEPTGPITVLGKNVRLTADGFVKELSADTLLVIP